MEIKLQTQNWMWIGGIRAPLFDKANRKTKWTAKWTTNPTEVFLLTFWQSEWLVRAPMLVLSILFNVYISIKWHYINLFNEIWWTFFHFHFHFSFDIFLASFSQSASSSSLLSLLLSSKWFCMWTKWKGGKNWTHIFHSQYGKLINLYFVAKAKQIDHWTSLENEMSIVISLW